MRQWKDATYLQHTTRQTHVVVTVDVEWPVFNVSTDQGQEGTVIKRNEGGKE